MFFFSLLSVGWAESVSTETLQVPLELTCHYTARDVNGVENLSEVREKVVKITPPVNTPQASVLVEKTGPYEFWVVANSVVESEGNKSRVEVLDYRAEIRDTKSGMTYQALSDSRTGRPRSNASIKRARVALAKYGAKGGANELLEVSSLRFHCHHVPGSDGPLRLKLKAPESE